MGYHDTQYWAHFVVHLVCSFHLMYTLIVCQDYFLFLDDYAVVME